MTLKPPIGMPANAEATEQRRYILGTLTIQNLVQVVIYLIALGAGIGAVRSTIASSAAQVEQNRQDILTQKKVIDEQHDFELRLSAKLDLILYRLDRLDRQPEPKP